MQSMAKPPKSYPEDVREAFEYCSDCEKVIVSVDQHTCSDRNASVNSRKSAAERARLAAADPRPREEAVLYPEGRSGNNAWAYHELDEDGEPLHGVSYDSGHQIAPRAEAIAKGCHPCETCERIGNQEGESDGE